MKQKLLYLFTRTPLHIGAGSSVGAIDQPVQRERHTGFPIVPASSLKGSFSDNWPTDLVRDGKPARIVTKKSGEKVVLDKATDAAWLFGSDDANVSFAGALQFGEARLLAFPVRSAKGSFAWVTCPLLLRRAERDGVIPAERLADLSEPPDEQAICVVGNESRLALNNKIVLEEYCFEASEWPGLKPLAAHMAGLLANNPLWNEVSSRLLILSNGMLSFFAQNACEIAQHVRISDQTGTAEDGALFNQENIPSETLFYAVVRATDSRVPDTEHGSLKAEAALRSFQDKLDEIGTFQFGGDSSTGLGYCSVKLS